MLLLTYNTHSSCCRRQRCMPPQTSTPASSFLVKSTTPESLSADSLQRTNILLSASSSYIDVLEEEHKLPYR